MRDGEDRKINRVAILAFALLGLLYALTATRHVIGTDNGEFVLLSRLGGVAHSPGYPSYVLYLRAMSWIPGVSAAHSAALATALLGWGASVALWFAARAWGARRQAALAAACLFGLNTEVWLVSTHAEAFAPNALLAALILLFSAPKAPLTGVWRVALLGLIAGVAISNHHSAVLLAPVGLYGVALGVKESHKGIFLPLVLGAGLLLVGLLPYATFPLYDPASAFVWGDFHSGEQVLSHFLREEYGTGKLGPGGAPNPLLHIPFFLSEAVSTSLIAGVLFGALGLLAIPEREHLSRAAKACLVGALLLCGPIFIGLFNMELTVATYDVIKRFHVLPMVPLTIFVAWGFELAHERKWLTEKRLLALMVALFLAGSVQGIRHTSERYTPAMELYAEHLLASAPKDAVIMGTGTHRFLLMEIERRLEKQRPDILFLEMHMLGRPWYVERVRRRSGLDIPLPSKDEATGTAKVDTPKVREVLERSGRPFFLTDRFSPERFDTQELSPYGVLWRVGASEKSASALVVENGQRFEQFVLPTPMPTAESDGWSWTLYVEYEQLWANLEERCVAEKDETCAEEARRWRAKFPAALEQ